MSLSTRTLIKLLIFLFTLKDFPFNPIWCFTLFVNILFSYKYVFLRILSSVIKLTYVNLQMLLFIQKS